MHFLKNIPLLEALLVLSTVFALLAANYWSKSKYSYLKSLEFSKRGNFYSTLAVLCFLCFGSIAFLDSMQKKLTNYQENHIIDLSNSVATKTNDFNKAYVASIQKLQSKIITLLGEIDKKLSGYSEISSPEDYEKRISILVHKIDHLLRNNALLENAIADNSQSISSLLTLRTLNEKLTDHISQIETLAVQLKEQYKELLARQPIPALTNTKFGIEIGNRPLEFDVGFPKEGFLNKTNECICVTGQPCLNRFDNANALNVLKRQMDESVVSVIVVGHHDYRDDPTSNYRLANRRAACLIKYLEDYRKVPYKLISGTNRFEFEDAVSEEELRSDRKAMVYFIKRQGL